MLSKDHQDVFHRIVATKISHEIVRDVLSGIVLPKEKMNSEQRLKFEAIASRIKDTLLIYTVHTSYEMIKSLGKKNSVRERVLNRLVDKYREEIYMVLLENGVACSDAACKVAASRVVFILATAYDQVANEGAENELLE